MRQQREEFLIHGIPASPGIAIGTALVIRRPDSIIEEREILPEEIEPEIQKFREALESTRKEIQALQGKVQSVLNEGEAKIFDAHLLLLDDSFLMEEVENTARKEMRNIDFIFNRIVQRYISAISKMADPYLSERAADIRDVAERVIKNLHEKEYFVLDNLPGQRIIIAHDITPSDTANLDRDNVQAFATEAGSRTSHTAIMARSMQIPAVVGAQNLFLDTIHNGDLLIVDGYLGIIIVNPQAQTLKLYADKVVEAEKYYSGLLKESRLWSETVDGFRVQLAANIQEPEESQNAKRYGAAGIGLFRTEFLFVNTKELPDEDRQFAIYSKLASEMEGHPIIIRTFDIGGDKMSEIISPINDPNPFLGYRAVRLFLEYQDGLRAQIRAILRASAFGNVKLMFPMVTNCEEVEKLLEMVDEEKLNLGSRGTPYNEHMQIGIMIEIPSAAILADKLAGMVDFFSIGTNDLVQYTLAVDRTNERVAYLYQPSHPAILHLLKRIVDAARRNGIWVSVCGEMASEPRYIPLLIGLGIHELSMSPPAIGPVRRLIRRMRMYDSEKIVEKALKCQCAKEALRISEELLNSIGPDILNMSFRGE